MAKARTQRHGETAGRRPPQAPRPDDEHGVAGDASCWCCRCPPHAQPAPNARPTGGSVVAGAAAISQTASNTQINQSSQRAAIDWQSFDVGSQQSVTFSQPSASAVALNRVTGPDPSQIAGRIDANGQIILVNQSGVNFYKGAQVNTAGLMVSAASITNENFMAGSMAFDQPGNPNARDRQPGHHHDQAGGAGRAGGAAGGQFRHDHRAAGPCRAGRGEDRDARSVWRRAAVAGRQQPGDAGAGRRGRQGGDRAGDQHRRDRRRWRHGATHRARGGRHRAEPGAGRRHDPRGDDGRSDRHRSR